MKLAVAIADHKAGPSAFVVWRGFAESIRKAARYGYDGVELALRTREEVDLPALQRLLREHRMEVSCVSTGQAFADLRLYLTNPDREGRQKAVEVIGGLVELAGECGGMVNLGRTRGFIAEGQTCAEAKGLFLDSLSRLLPLAERNGTTIVIEPVNRYEINFINSVEECAALVREVGSKHLGVMPDVFHMNIEDARIGQALAKHADLIRYLHLADSNRLAPGWGHLDFAEVFDGLRRGGYDGWASVEILPEPAPDEAARQAAKFLLPLVRAYRL